MLSKKSIKDIGVIKVKLIEIDSLLKGTLAIEKKKLDTQKRQESSKRREREEEKLETKPQAEKGVIKTPSLPRMGFLAWIKNFIGNVILGYFAVRLIDFLPLAVPIVKFIGRATDFVIDIGGKLLDGLTTFIDWGYKAYDATRGFMKNMFGQNQAKEFDRLSGALNQFLNLALIVGMATAAGGGFSKPGKGPQGKPGRGPEGKPTVTQGRGGQAPTGRPKITGDTGPNWWTKITSKLKGGPFAKLSGPLSKFAGSAIPFAGSAIGALDAKARFSRGEQLGGWMASISSALDAFSGVAALTGIGLPVAAVSTAISIGIDAVLLVSDIVKAFGGPSVPGMVGGGRAPATRGGVARGGVKRQIQDPGRKGKYKRGVAPRKPGKVEINSPGADAGGQEKIFGIFPKPKLPDEMNPFKVIKKTGEELGKSDYFGPILAITSKITAGQLPTSKDYENVGLGLNLLISKGIREKQLKGGLVAAFAEGGLVDPDVLSAAETGGDITNWVAKTFKGEVESNAQKTLRMIRENAEKKKTGKTETPPSPDINIDAGATSGGGTADTSLNPHRRAFLDTLAYAEGTANYPNTGYNTMFTGKQFSGYKDHPRQIQRSGRYASDAAGRYQFLSTTWDGLGFSDFSPANQDKGALKLLAPHVLQAIDKGDFATAFHGARKTWASLPGAGYGQPEKKMKTLVGYANARLEKYRKGEIGKPEYSDISLNTKDLGVGDGKLRFGRTGSMNVAAGYSHAHFDTVNGTPENVIIGDAVPLIKKMASQGLKPELADGTQILAGKDSKYYIDIIRSGIAQHTHRPGPRFDVNMPGFPLVPFSLKDIRNTPSRGEGINAVVPGSGKTALFHLGTKTNGSAFHGKSFGIVPKGGMRLTLHEGEVFKVVDKDSAKLLGYDLTKDIISIENNSDLIARAPSIIQKLKSISGYTDYEQPYEDPQVVTVYVPVPVNGNSGSSGGGDTVIVASGESNPFRSFYKGT